MMILFEDVYSSIVSVLSLDKLTILFADIHSSVINTLSLD